MKTKYVDVRSVDEYFSLPVEVREWYGFYKKPFALAWDFMDDTGGWTAFHREIRKHYPLQWFFREWLFSCANPVYRTFSFICFKFRDIKYALKHMLNPVFPRWRKTLPRHKYGDGTVLVVESNFNLILDFYYEEVIGCDNIDWQADERHARFYSELKSNVEWIENGRREHYKKMDENITNAHNNKGEKDYSVRYGEYDALEKQLISKETAVLEWLINNRSFFWT